MLASKWMLSLLMVGKLGPTNTKQSGPVTKSVCKLKLQLSSWLMRRGLQSELLHWISFDMNHLSMQYFLAQNIFFFLSSIREFSLRVYLLLIRHGLCFRKLSLHITENLFWHLNFFFLAIFSSSFQSLFPAKFSSRTKVNTDRNSKWPFMSSSKEECSEQSWDGIKSQPRWKLKKASPGSGKGHFPHWDLCSGVVGTNYGLCCEKRHWVNCNGVVDQVRSLKGPNQGGSSFETKSKGRQSMSIWGSRWLAIAASYCPRNGKKSSGCLYSKLHLAM